MALSAPRCPSCASAVQPRASNPYFPFCSERCRTVDLGRWLNEAYRVPVRTADDDEDGTAPLGAERPHEDA